MKKKFVNEAAEFNSEIVNFIDAQIGEDGNVPSDLVDDVLANYPELEDEDINQALVYAAASLDDKVV